MLRGVLRGKLSGDTSHYLKTLSYELNPLQPSTRVQVDPITLPVVRTTDATLRLGSCLPRSISQAASGEHEVKRINVPELETSWP